VRLTSRHELVLVTASLTYRGTIIDLGNLTIEFG
jgi:hypothetical protein